jgi:glycerol-3-phosphate acyltransferase PlsY
MKQIGRKLYHLLGGVGLLSLYTILGRKRALLFYAVLFILILVIDGARLVITSWNRFVFTRFGSFIRKNEEHRLTGTAPYVLGIGLSLYAYSMPVASAAICFLAFGDVAATAIGERFGKTKIGDKSLEGTFAFIVAAAVSGVLLSLLGVSLPAWVMVLGVLVAAGVELLTLPVNDNLLIPLVSGGIMELSLRMAG